MKRCLSRDFIAQKNAFQYGHVQSKNVLYRGFENYIVNLSFIELFQWP